jgi:hypothetical protein
LEKIEEATDLKFNIDEQWKDIPVSVTLDNAPLDKALKRILVNLNNVVIYGSNDQVKIVVFGKAEASSPSGRPAGPPSYKQPLPVPQPPPLPDENPSISEEPEPESRHRNQPLKVKVKPKPTAPRAVHKKSQHLKAERLRKANPRDSKLNKGHGKK